MPERSAPSTGQVAGEREALSTLADPLEHLLGGVLRRGLEHQQPPADLWQKIASKLQAQLSTPSSNVKKGGMLKTRSLGK